MYPKTLQSMKKSIMNTDDSRYMPSEYMWLSKLDYSKETSHPEFAILNFRVEEDYRKIQEGLRLMRMYIEWGASMDTL